MMPVMIRTETTTDHRLVYSLIKTAFQTAKVSDGDEQDFYENLKKTPRFIPELALVAEKDKHIIGQVLLTRFDVSCNDGTLFPSLLLGPIAIEKEYRSQGIGSALMKEALKRAKEYGFSSIFLVGNPVYYSRFGFRQTTDFSITNQDTIPALYVQAVELKPDALKNCAGTISFKDLV